MNRNNIENVSENHVFSSKRTTQFIMGVAVGLAMDYLMPNYLEGRILEKHELVDNTITNLIDSAYFGMAAFLVDKFLYKESTDEAFKTSAVYLAGSFVGQTLYQTARNLY